MTVAAPAHPRARQAAITTTLGLVVGGASWWTVRDAHEMTSTVQGLAQLDAPMPLEMSSLTFVRMGATMMTAMMLPAIAPDVLRRQPAVRRDVGPVVGFAVGYLAVWVSIGVVALATVGTLGHLSPATAWTDRIAGVVFVVAGLCHVRRSARRGAIRFTTGAERGTMPSISLELSTGLVCLRNDSALMLVLVAVGVMNVAWMAVLGAVCALERNWRHGARLATVVGVTTAGLGISVLLHPHFLSTIALVHPRTVTR